MRRAPFVALILPMLLAACGTAIQSPMTVFADLGKYEWYSCDQLVPQRKLWESKEKQLKLLMDKAKQSTGGSAISVVAYQGDYANAREELQVIDATARAKKCKMPGDWQSDSVIRGATVAALDLGCVLINRPAMSAFAQRRPRNSLAPFAVFRLITDRRPSGATSPAANPPQL